MGRKILVAITTFVSLFGTCAGHVCEVVDPGINVSLCDSDWLRHVDELIDVCSPSAIFSYVPYEEDQCLDSDQVSEYFKKLESYREKGLTVVVADTRNTTRWQARGMSPVLCRGDLGFDCHDDNITTQLQEWAHEREADGYPRCVEDLGEVEFVDLIRGLVEEDHLDRSAHVAFTGTEEDNLEVRDRGTIDGLLEDGDRANGFDAIAEADAENELLDSLPLPGHPKHEKERRELWLKLRRRARVATRRLHRNFRHLPKHALGQMLRAANAPK